MSHEIGRRNNADENKGAGLKVNGFDNTTFTISPLGTSLAAAHLPDEYFKLMHRSVMHALVIRSSVFAIIVAVIVIKFR